MRDSEKGGKKPIEAVEKLRTHKAKLERVSTNTKKHKKPENMLQESEDLYRAVMDNTFFGFTLIDRNYKIILVNSMMSSYFHKPAGELIGRECFREFEKRDSICPHCPGTRAMASGRLSDVETKGARHKTNHISTCIQAYPTFDSDGAVTGFIELVHDITERKKAEQELMQQRNLLRLLIDNLPDRVYVKDCKNRFILGNDAVVKYEGVQSEKELLGKTDFDLYPKELAATFYAKEQQVIQKGRPMINEEEFWMDKQGNEQWLLTTKIPLRDENGEIIGLVGINRDITERKKAEEALKKSEERFRNIFENSNVGISVTSLDGTFNANTVFCDMLGYSKEELSRVKWTDITLQEDIALSNNYLGQLRSGKKKSVRFQKRYVKKDGSIIFADASVALQKDEDGKPPYYITTIMDITERKKAEEELRISEERYRKQFEEAIDAIVLADPKTGMIVDCNIAATKLVEREKSEIIGKHQSFLHPAGDIIDGVSKTFKSHVIGEASELLEDRVITKSGQIKDVAIRASKITIEGKEVMQGIFRDITERKNMEEALRRNEARYRSSIELTGQLAWTTDSNGEVVEDIPLWRKFTGLSYEETKGSGWTKALHPEDAEHTRQVWGKAVKDKKAYEVEYRLRRFDEVYRDFLTRGIPVFKEDGSVREWVGVNIDVTERKNVQEQIEKLARFPEENSSPIYRVSKDGVLLYANPASRRLILEDRTKIGDKIPGKWIGMIKNVYDSGTRQRVEVELSGRIFLFEQVPVIEGGYVNSYAIDITELKKAGEALALSESKFRTLVEHLPQKIFIKDKNSVYLFANQSYAQDLKITPEEIIGKTDYDFYPKELAEKYLSDDKRIVETGKTEDIEEKYIEHGKEGWVHTIKIPYKDEEGNIIGVLGIFRDITEHKKDHEALKSEQKRLYDVLETMPVMVCLLTPDYHIPFANRSFREKFGEANGRHCYEYCFGRSEPCDFCETYNVLKTGKPHHWEVTSPDGRSIIDAYDFPFTDIDGSPLILEMDIDITERKRADKKIYDYQQQLKALSYQLSLIEERAKRKVTAGLHDNVGQRLAVAKLELQSLMRSSPDTKMSDSINSICGEITHIINDVHSLTFEIGNPLLDKIGLTAALEKYIIEEIQAKFGIKCELIDKAGAQDLEETVRTVLYRSARELLINAVKHAQAHNIKVRVYQSARCDAVAPRRAGNIHICVEDDGVGFEVSEIASLPTKTGGFGLFSIKEQLEYIGGNLQIESRVGHGTKITIGCPPKLKPAFA